MSLVPASLSLLSFDSVGQLTDSPFGSMTLDGMAAIVPIVLALAIVPVLVSPKTV